MIRFIPLVLLAATGTAVSPPAERRFDLGGFDAVDLASSDTVRAVPGSSFSVTADGDPDVVASLVVSVAGATLHVDRRPGRYRAGAATITVRMPTLRAVTLSGSGMIEADGVRGDGITARLSGSGQIRLPGLAVQHVQLVLGGSGSITARGRAERTDIDVRGSGGVDATALATPALRVDLGGSGDVAATASRTADIRAGGSGTVRIGGHPACAINKSGSARVTCG